jgi:hypothetical protein
MDKAKIKKATPIAVTLLIALTPQLLAFCDNRAKAYETRKAAKEAQIEAETSGARADTGYKVLLPAIKELQELRQAARKHLLAQNLRIDDLEMQVAALKNQKRPVKTLDKMTQPHKSPGLKPVHVIELPADLPTAHGQAQQKAFDAFKKKRSL